MKGSKELYLKPEEAKFVSMSVVSVLEELQESSKNVQHNWTPEVRKTLKDMIEAGEKLKIKLAKLGFDMRPLPPFEDGDIESFTTKMS